MSGVSTNGHWQFPEQMGGAQYAGFVYVIMDAYMKRAYLGKKNYFSRVNKNASSDWKDYISSSKLLQELLKFRPKDEFDFIVLEQYKAAGALAYAETWSLCYAETPTSENWYNKRIEKISWSVKEGITNRHKERLNDIIRRLK